MNHPNTKVRHLNLILLTCLISETASCIFAWFQLRTSRTCNLPASAFQVLGLHIYATSPDRILFFKLLWLTNTLGSTLVFSKQCYILKSWINLNKYSVIQKKTQETWKYALWDTSWIISVRSNAVLHIYTYKDRQYYKEPMGYYKEPISDDQNQNGGCLAEGEHSLCLTLENRGTSVCSFLLPSL